MRNSSNVTRETRERPSPRFLSVCFQKLAFSVLMMEQVPKSFLDLPVILAILVFYVLSFLLQPFSTIMNSTLAVWCFY